MRSVLYLAALVIIAGLGCGAFGEDPEGAAPSFTDEPHAHAMYDRMIAALRRADTLHYESEYTLERDGKEMLRCRYTAWLKKPNSARIEAARGGVTKGILVGDGEQFWIFWPDGKPRYQWEYSGKYAEAYERIKDTAYMVKPAPVGGHSLGHDIGELGSGIGMTILDPSTFHGYTDSLQPYLDGVRQLDVEQGPEGECAVVAVSFMKHQRSWILWISTKDCLPRKLKQIVRVRNEIVMVERWSNIAINEPIPDDKFVWHPPEGWTAYEMPPIEEGLLKPGVRAPDFKLAALGKGTISLADYRGKVVWLYVWRAG